MSKRWKPRGDEALPQRNAPESSPTDKRLQRWHQALTAILFFLLISLGAYLALQLL